MLKILFSLAAAVSFAAPGLAANYLPTGPQTNVALSTVTGGGWTQCYSAAMGAPFGNSASTTLAPCTGSRLLLAGRATGSDTLLVLAQALRSDVLFDTGQNDSVVHTANGTDFYNSDFFSLGFAPAGEGVFKHQCDTDGSAGRLCIHTFDFVGGYRINDIQGLNASFDYEKLAFMSDATGGVPEPAAWTLMVAGFGLIGSALRRHRAEVPAS